MTVVFLDRPEPRIYVAAELVELSFVGFRQVADLRHEGIVGVLQCSSEPLPHLRVVFGRLGPHPIEGAGGIFLNQAQACLDPFSQGFNLLSVCVGDRHQVVGKRVERGLLRARDFDETFDQ